MPAITLQHLLNRSSYTFENLFEGIKPGFRLDYIQIGIQFFNIPVFIVDYPGDRIIVCHVSLLQDRGSRSPRLKSGEESTLSISPYSFTPHAHSSCRMRFDRDLVRVIKGTKQELLLWITATPRGKRYYTANTGSCFQGRRQPAYGGLLP